MDEKRKVFINCMVDDFYEVAVLYTRLNNSNAVVPVYGNLTTRDCHVVIAIGGHPNINITELAQRFAMTKGGMSKTISRLTSLNFLEKTVADESGREVKVVLTPKGKEVYERHEATKMSNRRRLHEKLKDLSLSQLAAASLFIEEMNNLLLDYAALLEPDEPDNSDG
jgi:DNA-binding MarR family transcriptional regulator